MDLKESDNFQAVENKEIKASVLVVDDEKNIRQTLSLCLNDLGWQVCTAADAEQAKRLNEVEIFDLAFIDIRLGSDNGLDLIVELLERSPWLKIIVISAYASIDSAVEALNRGALNYIAKPFSPDQVRSAAAKALDLRRLEQRLLSLERDFSENIPPVFLGSKNPQMKRIIEIARQSAKSEASILITGPSGTGKTVLARAVHSWSSRAVFPFVTVSCPSLSAELVESELFGHIKGSFTGAIRDNPGKVAVADKGTVFLDEIGDLPVNLQPKLLRFLHEKCYERLGESKTRKADVRIITATNSDLKQKVQNGEFREDLFYRLNVIELTMPALRDRPEDILDISKGFLTYFCQQNHKLINGFSDSASDYLLAHSWKGNLRELRNSIERAVILCRTDEIKLTDLDSGEVAKKQGAPAGNRQTLQQVEAEYIRKIINQSQSLREASEILGIDIATLWRKRKLYHID
ncbi:MAG: sigma-54-dependent transcriptional regulator [Candidatus Rifleibacteriota bacterium]